MRQPMSRVETAREKNHDLTFGDDEFAKLLFNRF